MGDHQSAHLSDEQLARFQDGESSLSSASHLDTCPECANRLRDLQTSSAAYVEYRDSIRSLALPPAPKPWRSLDALISEHALLAEAKRWKRARSLGWWLPPRLAAGLCLLIAAVMVLRKPVQQVSIQASELLAQSAGAESPPNRVISIRLRGRTLVRPAVSGTVDPQERDPGLAHLQMVFNNAHYSWREPLSAGSFQSWRRGLRSKRDTVSLIHAAGEAKSYRIRTDTGTGILRSVSLTLRGERLRPANGAFQFAGEDPLEIDEAPLPAVPDLIRKPPPASSESPVETPASPADTLHVLAALNEIGADVGEPVSISEDSQHQVIVRAIGLNTDRRRQIADALKPLRQVRVEFGTSPSTCPGLALARQWRRNL
jgi:hypothetical protein